MKELKRFSQQAGYTYDSTREAAYGLTQGYTVIVRSFENAKQYVVCMSVSDKGRSGELATFLSELPTQYPFVNFAKYEDGQITINLKKASGGSRENINKVVHGITDFCVQNGLPGACSICGMETTPIVYGIKGTCVDMCTTCFGAQSQRMEMQNEEEPPKRSNMAGGIVGALIGSLVGVVLWVAIYQLGFIAGITGYAMVVMCVKGYELLGGRIATSGLWISIIIGVLMLFAAEYISVGIEAYTVFSEIYEITIMDAFSVVPELIFDPEIIGSVAYDMVIGYLFMAFAAFPYIKQTAKNALVRDEAIRLL